MNKKLCSITSTISMLALALFTAPGCALLGLEEEEETTTVVTGSLSDVAGTWASSCASDGSGAYETRTLIFSGTGFTHQQRAFNDSSCTDPRYLVQWTYNTMSAGAQTTLNDGTSGYGLSGTVDAVSWTVQSSSLVTAFNSGSGTCGKTDWTLNVAGDITGVANCGGSDVPSQGAAYADKYRVSGTNLYLNNLSGKTFTKQ